MNQSNTKRKAHPVVQFLGVSGVLVTIIMGGGLFIGWLSQGSLFYAYESKSVQATVTANEPGSLAETPEDKRHFLVVAFEGCPGVQQGLRVPPATGVGPDHAALAAQLRACLLQYQPPSKVTVNLELRRARLSGESTWRVRGVGDCDATLLETNIKADGEPRCDWM